jgi:hypothetical protein
MRGCDCGLTQNEHSAAQFYFPPSYQSRLLISTKRVLFSDRCGVRLEDAADDTAFGKHVEPDERLVGPTTSGSL